MKKPVFIASTKQVQQPNHKRIGKSIRNARLSAKLTQTDVAKAISVTTAYISDLELGKRYWTEDLFNKVARAIEQLKAAA